MEKLRKELEKEYSGKGKSLVIEAVFKMLEDGSGCMLEVNNVFTYLKYMSGNSYIDKYHAYIILRDDYLSISIFYDNLTLTSFHKLKDGRNIKKFGDLYNNKEDDLLYFISSINEVEVLQDTICFDIDILTSSSSLVVDTLLN